MDADVAEARGACRDDRRESQAPMAEVLQERCRAFGQRQAARDHGGMGAAPDPHSGSGHSEREEGQGTEGEA